MPIGHRKQCKALINIYAEEVLKLQAIATRLTTTRQKFIDRNVNPSAHEALAGHVAQLSNWVDDVVTLSNHPVANGLLIAYTAGKSNTALDQD